MRSYLLSTSERVFHSDCPSMTWILSPDSGLTSTLSQIPDQQSSTTLTARMTRMNNPCTWLCQSLAINKRKRSRSGDHGSNLNCSLGMRSPSADWVSDSASCVCSGGSSWLPAPSPNTWRVFPSEKLQLSKEKSGLPVRLWPRQRPHLAFATSG